MKLCLFVRIIDEGWGVSRLCALPVEHDGMHLVQTAKQIRRWWPDA